MMTKETAVVGLGNPLLSDDTTGLLLVKELESGYASIFPHVSFRVNYSGGFDLIYDLIGYQRAIIIDSIQTGNEKPGYCHEFSLTDFSSVTQSRLIDSHGIDLLTVLETGKKCGYRMPEDMVIFGIEGIEFTQLSENPSMQIRNTFTKTIDKIAGKLYHWNNCLLENASPINKEGN